MVTIKNINECYGASVEFSAETEALAVSQMLHAINACGDEFSNVVTLIEGVDYEII